MKKSFLIFGVFLAALFLMTACVAQKPVNSDIAPGAADASGVQGPAVMPALDGSGVTGDPSANLKDLVYVSGIVKEVNGDLVLITCADGGDFMLRFSENSSWAQDVSQEINVGNTISCTVRPEPTFTTPSQGEVFEVTENAAAQN